MPTDELRRQLQQSLGPTVSLEREIGGGGMSRVFEARDESLGRRIVVKMLAPELAAAVNVARFTREIRLVAALQQANIVPLISAGESNGLPYYTMPFVEGRALRDRMRESGGPLPVRETIDILRDVLRALDYAHQRDVIHRDIKPENILLSGGTAVVTDFGLGRALSAARTSNAADADISMAGLTQIGTALGTPAYIAPEQAVGDPRTDHRADLYAVGCVAYEMLTGAPPFAGRSVHQLIAAHVSEVAPDVRSARPECSVELAALVAQLMAKDAADRPASAREAQLALASMTGSGEITRTTTTNEVVAPPRRVWRTLRWAVPLTLLVLVVGGWYGVLSPSDRAMLTLLATREKVSIRVNRVVVSPLRNETGDSTLNAIGPLSADVMTSALATLPSLEVVDARTASISNEVVKAIPRFFRRGDRALALADEVGAAVVIDGSYSRQGDSVLVQARVLDAETGAIQHAFTDVLLSPSSPAMGLRELGKRAVTLMRAASDPEVAQAIGSMSPSESIEAADAFYKGYAAFMRSDTVRAENLMDKAVTIDTGWTTGYAGRSFVISELFWASNPARASAAVSDAELRSAKSRESTRLFAAILAADRDADAAAGLLAASLHDRYGSGFESKLLRGYYAYINGNPSSTLQDLTVLDHDHGSGLAAAAFTFSLIAGAHLMLDEIAEAKAAVDEGVRREPAHRMTIRAPLIVEAAYGGFSGLEKAAVAARRKWGGPDLLAEAQGLAEVILRGAPVASVVAPANRLAAGVGPATLTSRRDIAPADQLTGEIALRLLANGNVHALARAEPAVWASALSLGRWIDTVAWQGVRAVALQRNGKEQEARALDSLLAAREGQEWNGGLPTMWRARLASERGDFRNAVSLVSKALAKGYLRRVPPPGLADPFLIALRNEPGYRALLRPRPDARGAR